MAVDRGPEAVARARNAVEAVRFEVVRPVRGRVLHPGLPPAAAVRDLDEHPLAGHFGAVVDHAVVGVASTSPEATPRSVLAHLPDAAPGMEASDGQWWRVSDVAVDEAHRRQGLGHALVERCIDHAWRHGGHGAWLLAGPRDRRLFERLGFRTTDGTVDVAGQGPGGGQVAMRLLR